MDRNAIGTASTAGMQEGLHLIKNRYSIIALSFFPTYILCQPFSPIVMRKLGPIYFLSGTTFLMGAVMLCSGFVKVWSELVAIRVIIGALEAGFFPGSVYFISTWYARYDMQKRYAMFYIIGFVGSSFVGILSYGLMQMDGVAQISGWRWIFIIEGVITCILGFISFFILVEFPDQMKFSTRRFLNELEYEFILRRIERDRGDAFLENFSWKEYLNASVDVKPWAFGLIFFSSTTVAYAVSYFMPIILREDMGFTVGVSLCLYAPPAVAVGIVTFALSWLSDRYRMRAPVLVFNAILCLVGLSLIAFVMNTGWRLFGVFLTTIGPTGNIPTVMAYQANNIRGQWKRAICSSVFVGLGGIGGIAGSLIFRSQDAPNYYPGIAASMACNVLLKSGCGSYVAILPQLQ